MDIDGGSIVVCVQENGGDELNDTVDVGIFVDVLLLTPRPTT